MDRVFLDANVLFSAAYRPDAGLHKLWKLSDVRLLTSQYAALEARVNLPQPDQRARLDGLMRHVAIVPEAGNRRLPRGVVVPEKDRPILMAALEAQATHLLTGDVTHFGRYFGSSVAGMLILRPATYLRR